MRIDSPGLATDLALLELQGSSITDRGDHYVIRTPANPTFWWGNYLLLERAPTPGEIDDWVGRFEAEFPEQAHRTFGIVEVDADHSGWEARGYQVDVDIALAARPADVPQEDDPPAGIRAFETPGDWEQAVELGATEVSDDDIGDRYVFERRRTLAQRQLVESGCAEWFGAFVGDRLVAKLGIVALDDLARYQDVVTHEDFRRRGLAGALVRRAAAWAGDRPGVERLVIVAVEHGPAIGLYRGLGFVDAGRVVGVERPQQSS